MHMSCTGAWRLFRRLPTLPRHCGPLNALLQMTSGHGLVGFGSKNHESGISEHSQQVTPKAC